MNTKFKKLILNVFTLITFSFLYIPTLSAQQGSNTFKDFDSQISKIDVSSMKTNFFLNKGFPFDSQLEPFKKLSSN